MYKYLGYKQNYTTSDKKEAELDIKFYNRSFGLIEIYKDDSSLSMDEKGLVTFNHIKSLFLICNI